MDIPRFSEKDKKDWDTVADRIPGRTDVKERLTNLMAPATEHKREVHNESNISRLLYIYLFYPVAMASNVSSDMVIYARIQESPRTGAAASRDSLRADLVWHVGTKDGNKPCAIIEVKRDDKVDAAGLGRGNYPPGGTRGRAAYLQRHQDDEDFSWDANNANAIRQAAAYASDFGVRHVAICNFSLMALIYFSDPSYSPTYNPREKFKPV